MWNILSCIVLPMQLLISVAHSCDNLLTNTSGLVRSPAPYVNPGHESGFPCMTTILAAENHVIQLKFTKLDFGCDHGRLEVQDGVLLAGVYCDNNMPSPRKFISQSRRIALIFQQFGDGETGFEASYKQLPAHLCDKWRQLSVSTVGILKSPDVEDMRSDEGDKYCIWSFKTSPDKVLQLYVIQMYIPPSDNENCTLDYIEFTDYAAAQDYEFVSETHCDGSVEAHFVNVSSSAVDIGFTTNQDGSQGNFTIVYAAADRSGNCDGILMNPSGMIGSPDRGGGGENNVNINCVWAIIAPDGYRIQIDFVKIDIPLGAFAFVQTFFFAEGEFSYETWTGRLQWIPVSLGPIFSSTNVVFLQFYADHTVTFAEFKANYNFIEESAVPERNLPDIPVITSFPSKFTINMVELFPNKTYPTMSTTSEEEYQSTQLSTQKPKPEASLHDITNSTAAVTTTTTTTELITDLMTSSITNGGTLGIEPPRQVWMLAFVLFSIIKSAM